MEKNTQREPNKDIKTLKYVLYAIFIIYILMLLKIVLFKTISISDLLKWNVSFGYRSANLIPFQTVLDFMGKEEGISLRDFSNVIGNIGIFMPLGYLLPALFRKINKLSKVLLIAIILSTTFEAMQYFCYLGSLDIDDLMLNTIGAIIGYAIYRIFIRLIGKGKKLYILSVILSIVTFTIGFTIAKEEFGNILGLTTHETMMIGDENIPKSQPDIHGTYLSTKENKLEMYNSLISETSTEKEFLEKLTVNINENTKIYYMNIEEESKNKSVIKYKELLKEDLSKAESYSLISVWNDKSNSDLASVVVLSKKIDSSGEFVINTNLE